MVFELIKKAESYLWKPEDDSSEAQRDFAERQYKAIEIYKNLCRTSKTSIDVKLTAIKSFARNFPPDTIDVIDILSVWRDGLKFVTDDTMHRMHVQLLRRVITSPEISSYQRIITAICLYNNHLVDICYNSFADLANDETMRVDDRVEAAKFLFGSDDDDWKQLSSDCIISIIEEMAYPSEFRYRVIAGFISRTGISTTYNSSKLLVIYDEDFVYKLQTIFFANDKNGIIERILSASHMLQMECVTSSRKIELAQILLEISQNENYGEAVRANAADAVLRLGSPDQRLIARTIIGELGGHDGTRRTVYTDAQNVHNSKINRQITLFIERMIVENKTILPFNDVYEQVGRLVREQGLSIENRQKALKALNRIAVDTATFTEKDVTIAEILIHIWTKINNYPVEVKSELEKRLIEEFIDMAEWCSSGHSSRLINILSGYEETFSISWEDQIQANIQGRLEAKIKEVDDEELRDNILLGMLEGSEERDIYLNFLREKEEELRSELYDEFVIGGYLDEEQFTAYFNSSYYKWL